MSIFSAPSVRSIGKESEGGPGVESSGVSASVSLSLYLCPRHWVDVVATWRVLGVHQHATDDVPSPSAYPLDSLSLAKTLDSSKERLRDQVAVGLGLEDDVPGTEEGEQCGGSPGSSSYTYGKLRLEVADGEVLPIVVTVKRKKESGERGNKGRKAHTANTAPHLPSCLSKL
ncbi:hypothetical protein K443DRAFT_122257 [Laccaria amethystina LaAM-08-1]|uniref:Uncharacterized protein n=1 Tax=Laccaria amethystina LaAM-08-1 TaxID=1095629 RepID=A0A0C9Y105_9AGAR|nr:hypothetical protein K443DRAFT_122257 [Laccaria amethystina LaAM-08-1]